MRSVRVELNPRFILIALIVAVGFVSAWEIRGVIVTVVSMLFIAFIISAGLRPLVNSMQNWRYSYPLELLFSGVNRLLHPIAGRNLIVVDSSSGFGKFVTKAKSVTLGRGMAITTIYIGLIVLVVAVGILLTSEFVNQIGQLVSALPAIFDRIVEFLQNTVPAVADLIPVQELQTELGQFVTDFVNSQEFRNILNGQNVWLIFNQTLGIFSSAAELLISIITVVILSIYMLQRREPVYQDLLKLIPEDQGHGIRNVLAKIEISLGSWLLGQISLMFIIGIITYFIVLIPGFFDPNYILDDFAFPIAILAGVLEAIPNIGPSITLILASILALGTSGVAVVVYIVLSFMILQNLEAVFIVPTVMKRAIGLDPIMSILGIIGGFQIGGVLGAILAIPVIGIAQIVVLGISEEYKRSYHRRPRKLINPAR